MLKKISLLIVILLSFKTFSADYLKMFKEVEKRHNKAELNSNSSLYNGTKLSEQSNKISLFNQSLDYLHLLNSEWIGEALPSFGFEKAESNFIVFSNKEYSKILKLFKNYQKHSFNGEKIIGISVFTNGSSLALNYEVNKNNILGFAIESYILNGKGVFSYRTYLYDKETDSFELFQPYTSIMQGYSGCSVAPLLSMRLAQVSNIDTVHVSSSVLLPRILNDKYLEGRVALDNSLSDRLEVDNIHSDNLLISDDFSLLIENESLNYCGNHPQCEYGEVSCSIRDQFTCSKHNGWLKLHIRTKSP